MCVAAVLGSCWTDRNRHPGQRRPKTEKDKSETDTKREKSGKMCVVEGEVVVMGPQAGAIGRRKVQASM